MMGYRWVGWICGVAVSIAVGATVVMAQSSATGTTGPSAVQKADHAPCRATGTICFLGIDPDIYHMPLYGEYIQTGDHLICATRNWLSPHFKNRSPNDLDLFNLWEELSFDGHSDISVLSAQSPGADPWSLIAKQSITKIVVEPSLLKSASDDWLAKLKAAAPRLNVLLIDDGSPLAGQKESLKQTFAAYKSVRVQDHESGEDLLHLLAEAIATWNQPQNDPTLAEPSGLYRTTVAYFPAWKTKTGSPIFLTGQGGMAVFDSEEPSLEWRSVDVRIVSVLICLLGFPGAWIACRPMEKRRTGSNKSIGSSA
jgi:hypothetical protein